MLSDVDKILELNRIFGLAKLGFRDNLIILRNKLRQFENLMDSLPVPYVTVRTLVGKILYSGILYYDLINDLKFKRTLDPDNPGEFIQLSTNFKLVIDTISCINLSQVVNIIVLNRIDTDNVIITLVAISEEDDDINHTNIESFFEIMTPYYKMLWPNLDDALVDIVIVELNTNDNPLFMNNYYMYWYPRILLDPLISYSLTDQCYRI